MTSNIQTQLSSKAPAHDHPYAPSNYGLGESYGRQISGGDGSIDNVDVNGVYYWTNDNLTDSNKPAASGYMTVIARGNYVTQIAKATSNNYIFYIRSRSGSTWSNWFTFDIANHTHEYLPLSGGYIEGDVTFGYNANTPSLTTHIGNILKIGSSVCFGQSFPGSYLSSGRLFFKKA